MKCSHGHEHGSIVAALACSRESKAPAPRRCNLDAGGCGRTELEGAVLRDGSALCGACEESIAEAAADEDRKLSEARSIRARRAGKNWKGQAEAPNVVAVQQLADAFQAVGKLNHYMVGVVFSFSDAELEAAEQVLIDRQNAGPQKGKAFQALERALDEIESARTKRRQAAASASALELEEVARLAELEHADASDPTSVEHEEWQALKRKEGGR